MARKPNPAAFDGETHWLGVSAVAGLLGTTNRKIIERALAGEFRFKEDRFGLPGYVAEVDIAPLRAAKFVADRAKKPPAPRQKTPRQLEAAWAKISAENAKAPRDGPFTTAHLRHTLPASDLVPSGSKPRK
ncbi:MAG: hypothetical protein JWR80_615 [Bradyrhizobium sp.]|nr:hypothetical protein [Bradyrhizobium sp.]